MINAFDDAVFIVEKIKSGDYRFQVLNQKVADTIGLERSKILGKTLVEIFETQIAQKLERAVPFPLSVILRFPFLKRKLIEGAYNRRLQVAFYPV